MRWLAAILMLGVAMPAFAERTFEVSQLCSSYKRRIVSVAYRVYGPSPPISDLVAQLHTESNCRKDALSSARAQGMAQIIPQTQRGLTSSKELVREFPELAPAKPWDPSWSILAMAVLMRDNIRAFYTPTRATCSVQLFSLVGYVGSPNTLRREMRMCSETPGCNPDRWYGHVDQQNGRNPSAFIESRKYPDTVLAFAKVYEKAGWGASYCSNPPRIYLDHALQ